MRKRSDAGFTLIELVVVIVILGVIAALAIPSLLRARISANEAACVADVRTVISAQAAYRTANGGHYDVITCLSGPSACIPSYPANAPTFLDPQITALRPKSGYSRSFTPGLAPGTLEPIASPSSIESYVYVGRPETQNRTGIRGFAGGDEGAICMSGDGSDPSGGAPDLPPGCTRL